MSVEYDEIVRRHLDAFNAFMRDELSGEAYAELFDPEIEVDWRDERTYPDFPEHLQGVAELMAFTEQYRSNWVDLVGEALEGTEAPNDRVLILTRQSGRGRESGVPLVIHFFQLWTIRDGKVSQIEYFMHRSDAQAAAGLHR